jgi:hypothetical protein
MRFSTDVNLGHLLTAAVGVGSAIAVYVGLTNSLATLTERANSIATESRSAGMEIERRVTALEARRDLDTANQIADAGRLARIETLLGDIGDEVTVIRQAVQAQKHAENGGVP